MHLDREMRGCYWWEAEDREIEFQDLSKLQYEYWNLKEPLEIQFETSVLFWPEVAVALLVKDVNKSFPPHPEVR